ncbi:Nucleoporin [Escovopsis weberi]|uniref:Nucleoporin n=1 Tax=Escovopsis weberi TaxID=150374 RepID=A0A0M8MZR7_ESCWE|nr:Nucleoporin [Escovopsis weberi]
MFSPNSTSEGGPATATRSRRRQRPKTSEPVAQQPKAKRQRIPLTEQAAANTPEPQQQQPQPEMAEVKNDKVATLPVEPRNDPISETRLPIHRKDPRARVNKPKGERAAHKSDGSLILTSNNAYTVSKLPALPDRLRNDWSGPQHANVFSSCGYALTLTPTHAIVWPYNSTSQSPETFTFTIPGPSRPTDALPVGCLVTPSASSNEPGLVVVTASTGKVVFWESISSAATFAFIKKDRLGVEYTIYGISSGERVVDITNAESAGFILTFNTGRLAHMSVRDSHGRPSISVQFLRSTLTNAAGGLLSSIRHAFSNLSLKGDIAAVRADRTGRVGERSIVALSNKGKLQCWRIHRGGHNEPAGEADMRDSIISALWDTDPVSRNLSADSFEAVDFTFVPKDLDSKYAELTKLSNATRSDDPSMQHLLLLVSLTQRSVSRYSLVELVMTPRRCQVGMVRPITCYSTAIAQSTLSRPSTRPQLYLPRPALVAFVIFDRAAVVASVAISPDSPDSQLRTDSHMLTPSFEDVVDFREDEMHEIVGSGFEETPAVSSPSDENRSLRPRSKNPAAILVVRGAGVVRIATTDVDKFASDRPPKVSAKSKLEQAVFFGTKQHNPLVFDARSELQFSAEELTRAALEVSHEVLSSSTPYISTLPASLEDNLIARSNALHRLMVHLRAIGADLDRSARWSLLYNAEKMHVATLLWKLQEDFVADRPADDKKSLIGSIVEFIHQDQKHNPSPEQGEVDEVRHWFINDIFRLEIFIAWAYQVIKAFVKAQMLDDGKTTIMISEAVEVNVVAHVGALEFRKDNMALYGLENEKMDMGILQDGYEGLPEPWTGCHYVANNLTRLAELSNQWYIKCSRPSSSSEDGNKDSKKPDPAILEKLYNAAPVLTDSMLTACLEYARWAQTTPDQKSAAQAFANQYEKERYGRPIALGNMGKWEDGAIIAERHGSLGGLAVILLSHIEELEEILQNRSLNSFEIQNLKALREGKKAQLEDRLAKYGKDFAFPLYEYMLEKHGVESVLEFPLETLGFKTLFLRSKPELARISWINDIQREKDVGNASQTLVNLALNKEQQVWAKKIELSLGKLALLAETEQKIRTPGRPENKADDVRHDQQLQKVSRELVTVQIQDQVYKLVYSSTHDAIDESAALNLAMEAFGGLLPKKQKALRQLLEDGLERLLKHEALDAMTLIDVLTLADWKPELRDGVNPFWLALRVADSSCHSDEVREAKQLVWRRLFIRDDWAKINDTQQMDDHEVVARLADTELYTMLIDCVRNQNSGSEIRPLAPAEALGAFTGHLDRRFRDFETGTQRRLLEAMQYEDQSLTKYIDKSRLAEWLRTALEAAHTELETLREDGKAAADALAQEDRQQHEGVPSSEAFGAAHDLGVSMPGGLALFSHA